MLPLRIFSETLLTATNDLYLFVSRICIEDSGIGVSDEQLETLSHSPHYMMCDADIAQQRHGLGLLIVKQILDGHQGNVVIDHSPHGGLSVTLILPKAV